MLINNAVITGSLSVNGTDVTYITGSSQISSSFLALSSSYLITSASYVVTSGSYAITSASFAQTSGSLSIRTGNLEATSSTLTSASSSFAAQSASLSTRLTTDEANITTLTNASASFAVVSSSFSSTSGSLSTRVTNLEATSSTVSSSFASTSGSIAGRVTLIEGQYATTGSNNFTGPQFINQASNAISFTSTASLYTDGGLRVAKDSFVSGTAYFNNITVYGTSSIEYITSSQVNIGSNVITVNTDTPAIRFGGISVFDSGSTQLTGSLFWDSEKNHWIYSNPSGSSYNSAMLMNGPRNTGSLGTEQGTTNNALMKGQGGDHITSSQMIDDGTTVQIPGNLQVTGSLSGSSAVFSSTINATNGLLIGNGGATATSGYVPKFTGTSTIGNSQIFDNGTNVGIGTANPNQLLHLYKASSDVLLALQKGSTYGYVVNDGTNIVLASNEGSTGYKFLVNRNAPDNAMIINASGNLGLGVTPSAWLSTYRNLQIGLSSSIVGQSNDTRIIFNNNAYYSGSSQWVYLANSPAAQYTMADNNHFWYTAPSGTAGNAISFTQAMTLNASGNLSVGNTNNTYKLDVTGTARFTGQVTSEDSFYAVATPPATNGGLVNVRDTVTATNVTSFAGVFFNSAPGSDYSIGKLTENNAGFLQIRNANSGTELLRINSTGAATFSSSVTATSFRSTTTSIGGYFQSWDGTNEVDIGSWKSIIGSGNSYDALIYSSNASSGFYVMTGGSTTPKLTIASTGAATFSSSVTAGGDFTTVFKSWYQNTYSIGSPYTFAQVNYNGGVYCGIKFVAYNPSNALSSALGFQIMDTGGNYIEALYLGATGAATFSSSIYAGADITAYSDAKLKENVVTIDNALEKVKALRGVFYNRIDTEDKSRKIGVIAQEVQEVLPEVVSTNEDTLSVAYGNIVGVLIEAIKEQQTQIEELKTLIHGLTK